MSSPSVTPEVFPVKQTSGFFSLSSVINDPPPTSNPLTMHLFVSNFSTKVQTASYALWKLTNNGKELLQNGQINAPVKGAGVVEINAGNFLGETLEVVFGFTSLDQAFSTAPSLIIYETFVADGATRPIFYVATGAFAFLGTEAKTGQGTADLATPNTVPAPNSYSRRISSNNSTLALQSTVASAPGSPGTE